MRSSQGNGYYLASLRYRTRPISARGRLNCRCETVLVFTVCKTRYPAYVSATLKFTTSDLLWKRLNHVIVPGIHDAVRCLIRDSDALRAEPRQTPSYRDIAAQSIESRLELFACVDN